MAGRPNLERGLVLRGLLAGLAGGAVAFAFARVVAEPQIQAAIDYESGRDAAQRALDAAAGVRSGGEEVEVFNRAVQGNAGIGVGMVLFGASMGLLFAFAYTFCLGRVGRLRPRTLSMLVAGAAFLTLYVVPFLKYPANPPSVGQDDTIWDRTNGYLILVGCSIAVGVAAVVLGRRLQGRFGSWNATLLAAAAYAVVIGAVAALLPHWSETPPPLTDSHGTIVFPGFPADTLATFRLTSLIAQGLLWTTIGLVFAPLAERLLAPATAAPAPLRSLR